MKAKRVDWYFVVELVFVAMVGALALSITHGAHAGDKHIPTPQPHEKPIATATASPIITANSGGGAGNANLYSDSHERSLGVALANGAPIPPDCPDGLVPGKGLKRGYLILAGGASAVCVPPDEEQAAAMQKAHDNKADLLRLNIELVRAQAAADREAASRAQTERCSAECVNKN